MSPNMTFSEYARRAKSTAMYPPDKGLEYLGLGLTGEAGEIANKAKKVIRDFDGEITSEFVSTMKGELGDVLWYLTLFADFLGIELEEVAEYNAQKLESRHARGKIQGSGDDR